MEPRKYLRLENPEEVTVEDTIASSPIISSKSLYISGHTGPSLVASSHLPIKINDPEDVMIGNKNVAEYIEEKVTNGILDNLGKMITTLPTDQNLGTGEILVVGVEVGDMPKEQVVKCLSNIKELLGKQGLTRIIVYAKYHGVGALDFDRLSTADEYIE